MAKSITVPTADVKAQRRAEIGQRLRSFRKRRDLTLVDAAKALEKGGYRLSASQLSRIETGEVPANTDDLTELCKLLGISWPDLIGPRRRPWFIVRRTTAKSRLKEVMDGDREIVRRDESHDVMIKKGIYRYVPLEENDDYVLAGDSERDVKLDEAKMQKYLFEIKQADEDEMVQGLDNHIGEEIIYVIDGEIEFWFEQEDSDQIRTQNIENRRLSSISIKLKTRVQSCRQK